MCEKMHVVKSIVVFEYIRPYFLQKLTLLPVRYKLDIDGIKFKLFIKQKKGMKHQSPKNDAQNPNAGLRQNESR